jgi:hypothetical protein
MVASMKMTVFWDTVPCSLVEIDPTFLKHLMPPSAGHHTEMLVNFHQTARHNVLTVIFIFAMGKVVEQVE